MITKHPFIKYLLGNKGLWLMLCALLCVNVCHAQIEVEEGKESEDEPENIALDDTTVAVQEVEEVYDSSFNYMRMESIVCDANLIRAGLLYDAETNTVVWEKDMNYSFPIASVTKIMVALLAIEDIETGRLNWNDQIQTTSYKYVGKRRRKKKVYFHRYYTLRDMIKMVMIESNNYGANLVATHAGRGNMDAFIDRMNAKALQLGMTKTFYTNPSGLPAYRHEMDNRSSPHDLLLLAKYAINNRSLMEISNMGYAEVNNGVSRYTIRNHNALVRDFIYEVEGIKTGFTTRAGFCLVTTSKRYQHRLIAIALGARSSFSRNAFVSDMMSQYYIHIGLGPMGIKISDEALAAVKPGLDNSKFNYPQVRVNPYYIAEPGNTAVAMAGNMQFKTVYVQAKKYHKVRYGETLSGIADKYNVNTSQLRSWNRIKGSTIRAGQTLAIVTKVKKQIPVMNSSPVVGSADIVTEKKVTFTDTVSEPIALKKEEPRKAIKAPDTVAKANISEGKKYYKVQRSEGLFAIARKHNCSVAQLREWNKLESDNISYGSVLVIYPAAQITDTNAKENIARPAPAIASKPTPKASMKIKYVYHTVQPGDTLWTIAQKYPRVTVQQIKLANNIRNHKSLLPGTKVKVPIT